MSFVVSSLCPSRYFLTTSGHRTTFERSALAECLKPSGEITPPQNAEVDSAVNVPQSTPAAKETAENTTSTDEQNNHDTEENPQFEGRMPGGMQGSFPGNMQNNNQQTKDAEPMTFWGFVKTYSTPIASVILLALAFIFVIFYRRKNY